MDLQCAANIISAPFFGMLVAIIPGSIFEYCEPCNMAPFSRVVTMTPSHANIRQDLTFFDLALMFCSSMVDIATKWTIRPNDPTDGLKGTDGIIY